MSDLSQHELMYLLHVYALARKHGSVTQGDIKKTIAKEGKVEKSSKRDIKQPDEIYSSLLEKKLIDSPRKSRISITDLGLQTLIHNLISVDEDLFDSNKGPKMLNALIHCIKLASYGSDGSPEDTSFDTFIEDFKKLYIEERKRQELKGVSVIYKQDMYQLFQEHSSPISADKFKNYFNKLQLIGKVFTTQGDKDDLVHWVE